MNIRQLLQQPQIWRGRDDSLSPRQPRLPTGWEPLDTRLGGWIPGALTEILTPTPGCGELTLLAPALKRLTHDNQRLIGIAPPETLYPPALQQRDIPVDRVILIEAAPRDALWAAEQCLRSGACGAVLCWPDPVSDRQLRRLQLAAEQGRCHGFVFRPARVAQKPSPAATRILFDVAGQVEVIKCRGGFSDCRFHLDSPAH
ncbi:MAG: translesion DNA synthesis-associated protein ImuA [Xanthomonadales bacterium]|nr:translesion DNA synthesis-associated protein ImuA [Xanthomonadales bacterium]